MILQCFLRGIGLSFRDAFSKVELSYKCAAEQSFLPRSGLGIKPGVFNRFLTPGYVGSYRVLTGHRKTWHSIKENFYFQANFFD